MHVAPTALSATSRQQSRAALAVLAVLAMLALLAPVQARAADPAPVTYKGAVFGSAATAPTADKPQSKLWHQDGSWWALMVDPSTGTVRIHELRSHVWRAVGPTVDERPTSTGDALWDGTALSVATRTAGGALRIVELTYDRTARSYAVKPGFPVAVASSGAESMTLDKDSRGRLWATWTQGSAVWVAHSTTDHAAWTAPFRPPVGDTAVAADDISAVIAFGGKIGVMWSDQQSEAFRFAIHDDAAAGGAGWSVETPLAGTRMADDHINLKTLVADSSGRVHAAIKTSQGDGGEPAGSPSIAVLTRSAGTWSTAVAGTVGESLTRPMILLDETNKQLYLLATAPESGGTVYYKKAPLSDIRFGNGRGAPFLSWSGAKINNVTGSKHPVSAQTGIVVLGADSGTRTYYHAELALPSSAAGDTSAPSVPSGVTASALSSTSARVQWSPSQDDVGVSAYQVLRNGALVGQTPGTSFDDGGLSPATSYSYAVRAVDAAGNVSGTSTSAQVTTLDPPSGGATGVALVGASAAGNRGEAALTLSLPTGVAPGHVLVASVDVRGAPTVTPPPGWTLVRLDTASTTMRKATYVRVAESSEPATSTWLLSKAYGAAGVLAAYSGVSTSSPVEAVAGQVNASSTAIVAPAIPAGAGARVLGLFGIARATTVTPPSGMVERGEATSQSTYVVTSELADETRPTAGSTGSRSASASGSAVSIGHLLSLRPANP